MRRSRWSRTLVVMLLLASMLALVGAGSALAQPPERVKVLIGFAHQPGPAEQALVHRAGGTIKYTYHLVPAIAATVPEAAIDGLRRNPNVTNVDLDLEVHAIVQEVPWGIDRIDADLVHAGGNTGDGVKVAIIDSGIDYTHKDLDANYAGGYDFVNTDGDPMDDAGHGTHVAGTVAAEDNDIGVVGVAPMARLYALKVLDETGTGNYSDIIAALQWAVDNGMQVTNNSYGSPGDPGDPVKEAFDIAYAAGILNVCAAGNSGTPPGRGDNVEYPARYESCIAVAATEQDDDRARFSSTGPDVELAAPGVDILSTYLADGYARGSGTSMASPHVAGTAALVIASGVVDATQVRQRLIETADDLGDAGRDTKYGYGLVDADQAAAPTGPVNEPPTVSISSPVDGVTFDSGAEISFVGTASDPEEGDLTASLVWTSSVDGPIGTGGTFSFAPSDGSHTITASVTDSGGKSGSASIGITVGTPPGGTMYVDSITFSSRVTGRNRSAKAIVTIRDTEGNAVDGATVYGTWSGDYSASVSGVTGIDGTVSFTSGKVRSADAVFTFTVDDVSKGGWTYDSSANGDFDGDGDIGDTSNSITVP